MKASGICASLGAVLFPFAVACTQAAEMRAAVVVDGVPQIQTVSRPEPQSGQVLIRVRAASVNPVDWKVAARATPNSRSIPGRDLSGVIEAVGADVKTWKPGDAVIAIAHGGSYAQYALADSNAIGLKPPNLSFEEAAGLPIVGETAWRAIVTVGNVQKGQKVLIHGGAGGVGSCAVQIAKSRGAHVIATASPRNHEFLRSLGADDVIDYNTVRFEENVKDLDMVLNTANTDTGVRSIGVIKRGGILVSIVGAAPAEQCSAAGIRCAVTGTVTGAMLPEVSRLAATGKLKINIEQRLPLADAVKAWESSRKGHTRGKLILVIPD